MPQKRILVGEIGRPHSFTADPAAIASYPLTDESGARCFAITLLADGLARVEGVEDRTGAERLTGQKLFVERALLPATGDADEFYLADLIGLAARDPAGVSIGMVRAVEDHGAGCFMVLETSAGDLLVPFTQACVPVVDVAGGFVSVVPPGEVLVTEGDAA